VADNFVRAIYELYRASGTELLVILAPKLGEVLWAGIFREAPGIFQGKVDQCRVPASAKERSYAQRSGTISTAMGLAGQG
jgi:hypothetical protein